MRKLVPIRMRGRRRGRVAIAAALTTCVVVVGVASAAVGGFNPFGSGQVGQTYANGILLPTNQWVSPLGSRIVRYRCADVDAWLDGRDVRELEARAS